MSPSAVSHQIRALEEYLATALFLRDGNRVSLTFTGKAYAGHLTQLLDDLDYRTREVHSGSSSELRLLSTPGFAARWLLPRLSRFEHHEAIRLKIAEGAPSTNFASNDSDLVIQWRDDVDPGTVAWPLMHSARYPVAAPGFAKRHRLRHPRDLQTVTLFQDQTDDMWSEWFQAAGVNQPITINGPSYPNCEFATTAAEAGLGVSLAYDAVAHDTVKAGRLERLFDTVTPPFTIYSVACAKGREQETLIDSFRRWLVTEALQAGVRPDPAEV